MRLIDADVVIEEINRIQKLYPFTDRSVEAKVVRGCLFDIKQLIKEQPTIERGEGE